MQNFPTPSALAAMSAKDLAGVYNEVAAFLRVSPVNRFSDKAVALKRTMDLIAKAKTEAKAEAKEVAVHAKKEPAKVGRRRGTNLTPFGTALEACREGTKQAAILDVLAKGNATMDQLLKVTAGGKTPWKEISVRSAFGWDLRNKGYGIRSDITDKGVEVFNLVFPPKFTTIPAHIPKKG